MAFYESDLAARRANSFSFSPARRKPRFALFPYSFGDQFSFGQICLDLIAVP